MFEEELGDRTGVAWQEFAMGAAGQTMMRSLDDLFGRESLLCGRSRSAEPEQASKGCDFETGLSMEQEMAEKPGGIIVAAARLQKLKSRLQQAALLGRQACFTNPGLGKPLGKGKPFHGHGAPFVTLGETRSEERRVGK